MQWAVWVVDTKKKVVHGGKVKKLARAVRTIRNAVCEGAKGAIERCLPEMKREKERKRPIRERESENKRPCQKKIRCS